jgi:hypothetical protein
MKTLYESELSASGPALLSLGIWDDNSEMLLRKVNCEYLRRMELA